MGQPYFVHQVGIFAQLLPAMQTHPFPGDMRCLVPLPYPDIYSYFFYNFSLIRCETILLLVTASPKFEFIRRIISVVTAFLGAACRYCGVITGPKQVYNLPFSTWSSRPRITLIEPC